MSDIDRVKRNIGTMIDKGAPQADIDAYVASEGMTAETIRASSKAATFNPDPAAGGISDWSPMPALRSRGERVLQGAATLGQGMFMGAGDELGAGIAATVDPITANKWPGKSWGERYDAALANVRGNLRDFSGDHPYLAPALEIAGSVGAAGPIVGGAKVAPTVAGRLGQAAITGAGFGGASGFLSGEGGPEERAKSAGIGATIGGVAAPALVGLGNALAWGVRRLGMISDTPEQRSAKLLALALARDATTADDVAARVAEMNRAGVPAQAVDAAGENVKALARAASSVPGAGRQAITEAVAKRTEALHGAADDALLRAFNPEDFVTRRDKLIETIRKNASEAYDAAFSSGKKLTPDKELLSILETPAAQRAMQEARDLHQNFGKTTGDMSPVGNMATNPSTEFLHTLKMQLDDIAGRAPRSNLTGKPSAEGTAFIGLARRLSDWIKKNNPDYKAAAAQYSDDAGRIEALKLGSEQFFKMRPEELAAKVKEMGPAERELFLTGVYDGFLTKGYNVLRARDHMATDRFEERVKAVLPKDLAERMLDRVDQLREFQNTTRFISPRTNSPTFGRALDFDDASGTLAADTVLSLGNQAAHGKYVGALATALSEAGKYANHRARGLSGETAAELVRILTSDPKVVGQTMSGSNAALQTATDKLRQQQMLSQILGTGLPAGGVTAYGNR